MTDIEYYGGNRKILQFANSLVNCIAKYTLIKVDADANSFSEYKNLLSDFISNPAPTDIQINPLINVVYYDYLGLTYMKLYRLSKNPKDIENAQTSFEKALEFSDMVDTGENIWHGFIEYNLARAYEAQYDFISAESHYKEAIRIRKNWLNITGYNVVIRAALSSEYFLAWLDYTYMRSHNNMMTKEEIKCEYNLIESKLDAYYDVEKSLVRLADIRSLMKELKNSMI